MRATGRVVNGRVVLDEGSPALPEGAKVVVTLRDDEAATDENAALVPPDEPITDEVEALREPEPS